jgi:hypothetical protein
MDDAYDMWVLRIWRDPNNQDAPEDENQQRSTIGNMISEIFEKAGKHGVHKTKASASFV